MKLFNTYYINNTKIANELKKGRIPSQQETAVFVGKRGTPTACHVKYRLPDSVREPMDWEYAMAIADAVYTIYKQGEDVFSLTLLLQTLSGDSRQKVSRQKQESLTTMLELLSETTFALDCVDEMLQRRIITKADYTKWLLRDSFLPLCKIGKNDYQIPGLSPLYQYAEAVQQIIAFPPSLLQISSSGEKGTSQALSNTRETILLKRYLIQQLEVMRNPKNSVAGRTIYYQKKTHTDWKNVGLFPALGIFRENYTSEDSWNHKKAAIHKNVLLILDSYKGNYIEDYQIINTSQGMINGVEILGTFRDPKKGSEN